ncbi:hypothetical protein [Salinirarus marinus]|uniref:hypothetical protein n=1 Tax=Salinirarus marinus TaxID=3068310 RepID=UPI003C6C89E1
MGSPRTASPRRTLLLALGLVLVTVPLWAPPLDVTGDDYDYRAAQVAVDDNRLSIPGRHPWLAGVEGVDCFHEQSPSRRCGFESRLLDGAAVRAPYPGVRHVAGDPTLVASERYVAFSGDGRVFERTTEWNDSAEAYVLGLERADASRVVDGVARPVAQYNYPIRQTVKTGSARAADPLSEPELVESSGRYYVVYEAGTRTFLSANPLTERLLEWVAVVAGVLAFRRAWRE